jgi:hypothetical protein
MASKRKVKLNPRALAKLMLLEYFKPASFRRLAELQAAEEGYPAQLHQAELAVMKASLCQKADAQDGAEDGEGEREDSLKEAEAQSPGLNNNEIKGWLEDVWLNDWLALEPSLHEEDLRPYFYFSRDILSPLTSAAQRLTPRAQELLAQLLQESEAVRNLALKSAKDLNEADAAAVFEELVSRARREENFASDRSVFKRIFEWVGARPELAGQLVIALDQLSQATMPPSTIPLLARTVKGSTAETSAARLIQRWGESAQNKELKNAAQRQLSSDKKSLGSRIPRISTNIPEF